MCSAFLNISFYPKFTADSDFHKFFSSFFYSLLLLPPKDLALGACVGSRSSSTSTGGWVTLFLKFLELEDFFELSNTCSWEGEKFPFEVAYLLLGCLGCFSGICTGVKDVLVEGGGLYTLCDLLLFSVSSKSWLLLNGLAP